MSEKIKKVIHTIINDFSRYRKFDIDNLLTITEQKIIKDIDQNGYFRIDAQRQQPRGNRSHVIMLILDPTKKYSHNSPELKKLYKSIESEESYKNNTLDEVILIVGDIFETKKNLLEVVKAEQQKEIRGPDFAGRAPVYNLMYFRNLVSCIPEYIGVPEHIIMTPAESQEFLESQLKNPKELPLIPHTDPQILWIGGRQGQLVKIIRDSDTTGKTIIIKTIT